MTTVTIQFDVDPYLAQQLITLYQVLAGEFPNKPRPGEYDALLDTLAILNAQVQAMCCHEKTFDVKSFLERISDEELGPREIEFFERLKHDLESTADITEQEAHDGETDEIGLPLDSLTPEDLEMAALALDAIGYEEKWVEQGACGPAKTTGSRLFTVN